MLLLRLILVSTVFSKAREYWDRLKEHGGVTGVTVRVGQPLLKLHFPGRPLLCQNLC